MESKHDIRPIHNQVFNRLLAWSSDARYTKSDRRNPYFYMRSVNDTRFRDGYWFPGNADYLCVSFWAGGDTLNKTPNVYFEISLKNGCRAIIVAKDSEFKANYFGGLVKALDINKLKYKKADTLNIWMRQIDKSFKSHAEALDSFLENDKILIDNYLYEHEQESEGDEFTSTFGFIKEEDFEKNYSRVKEQRSKIDEELRLKLLLKPDLINYSIQLDNNNNTALPYALKSLVIKKFQGVNSASLKDLPISSKWVFITGENGYGKTSILQSIALGLCNDRVLDSYVDSETRIEVCVNNPSSTDATMVRLKSGTTGSSQEEYNVRVIAYGPVRLNTIPADSRNLLDTNNNNVLSLFVSSTLLKNIQYELFAKMHTNKRIFEQLTDAVREATSDRIEGIELAGEQVLFKERLSNGDLLPALPLEKLAAGFRNIINIVGDIIVRMSSNFPDQEYKEYAGFVLIDEIETHLHPILQRELPQALSKVFPCLQFIATTHSPIPLLGAPNDSVIITVGRTELEGITMERLDDQIDFFNLLPNTILTSPIFGFDNIIPVGNTKLADLSTGMSFQESVEISNLKTRFTIKDPDEDFDADSLSLSTQQ